jgi:hypothetical protein
MRVHLRHDRKAVHATSPRDIANRVSLGDDAKPFVHAPRHDGCKHANIVADAAPGPVDQPFVPTVVAREVLQRCLCRRSHRMGNKQRTPGATDRERTEAVDRHVMRPGLTDRWESITLIIAPIVVALTGAPLTDSQATGPFQSPCGPWCSVYASRLKGAQITGCG